MNGTCQGRTEFGIYQNLDIIVISSSKGLEQTHLPEHLLGWVSKSQVHVQ